MTCVFCSKSIPDDSKLCPYCGSLVLRKDIAEVPPNTSNVSSLQASSIDVSSSTLLSVGMRFHDIFSRFIIYIWVIFSVYNIFKFVSDLIKLSELREEIGSEYILYTSYDVLFIFIYLFLAVFSTKAANNLKKMKIKGYVNLVRSIVISYGSYIIAFIFSLFMSNIFDPAAAFGAVIGSSAPYGLILYYYRKRRRLFTEDGAVYMRH